MDKFVVPVNTRTNYQKSWWLLNEEYQRARWKELVSLPEKYELRRSIVERLCYGFAEPNGSMAWTILFSDFSREAALRIINIAGQHDADRNLYDAEIDDFDNALVHALRYFLGFFTGHWKLNPNKVSAFDIHFMECLPIVECGWEISHDYSNPAWACSTVLRSQLGLAPLICKPDEDLPLEAMADPTALKNNMHAYIDTLVLLNNEVQRYCSSAREHAMIPEIEFMHSIQWTDEEIEKISASSPAILFCQSIKNPEAINPQLRIANPDLCLV